MNYDHEETAYTLYACNFQKERGSMRPVAVAGNTETLYAVIGNEIMEGNMDYRGYSEKKGFDLFREDYKNGEIASAHLDYGFIEDQPLLLMGSEAVQREWEQTYDLLNMSDAEYEAIRSGDTMKGIAPDRLRQILDRALHAVANDYRGAELYEFLHGTLEMQDAEIHKAGFNLSEFYADPDECPEHFYTDEQEDEEDEEI